MSDEKLRRLEAAWKASGDWADQTRYMAERFRVQPVAPFNGSRLGWHQFRSVSFVSEDMLSILTGSGWTPSANTQGSRGGLWPYVRRWQVRDGEALLIHYMTNSNGWGEVVDLPKATDA